jgi:hypothetical protein
MRNGFKTKWKEAIVVFLEELSTQMLEELRQIRNVLTAADFWWQEYCMGVA